MTASVGWNGNKYGRMRRGRRIRRLVMRIVKSNGGVRGSESII